MKYIDLSNVPSWTDLLQGILHLVYPARCKICGSMLADEDNDYVCSYCLDSLPRTRFEYVKGNKSELRLGGKADIYSAFSGYYFRKGERLRLLVHAFKYYNRRDIAVLLGEKLGKMMLESGFNKDYDFLVPVPLHPKKYSIRGYNQACEIAKGISNITGLAVREDILYRVEVGSSQTKKKKHERWNSIQNTYVCEYPERNAGSRLLLVDDILTTGSTIEVCHRALRQIPYVRIGFVTVGIVDNGS